MPQRVFNLPSPSAPASPICAATGYSNGGLTRLAKEAAFCPEALAGVRLVVAYAVMEVTAAIRLSAAVLYLPLIAMEAVNTAIEEIIDHISPEMSDTGKHAKDLGSLAVFCLVSANSILLHYALSLHLTV
ncbi:diacylglycerol kinase [Sinorhizobium medicae]|nr:diacylglycerol kinase [Sinorhizobium medicae]MDX0770082.1 diacylglycerol kinase [Sinorhizobium medicae]